MWIVTAICSDDACAAEEELVVSGLEGLEDEVCECGYCLVVLSIANFEPALPKPGLRLLPPLSANEISRLAA